MIDIRQKSQNIHPKVEPTDIKKFAAKTGNLYEALAIISKRTEQLNVLIKEELHKKLEEFAIQTDTIEEIQENKEQIEISKFYERLPNSALIATEEFLNDELEYRHRNATKDSEEAADA